jgi:hypothetical protein
MPTANPKQALLELLRKHHEIQTLRGSDVVALNSKAILYLRYNKNSGPTKKLKGKFWFGITKSEYDKYSNSNFFIICVCVLNPRQTDYIVFPSYDFDEIKKNIPLQSGQWKFNLLKTLENTYMLQVAKGGMYDVTEYLNFLDFSPKNSRKISSPSFSEIKAPDKGAIGTIKGPEPSDLETELLTSARDSSNPKRFEVALERFFSEIGFKCKRIGGSGETDVLVYEPIRMIIDGKSTKSGSKSSINFTRIKGHKAKNDAAIMVIASVGFDPAVCRDAELEGACLIEIESLIELLRIHKEFVLSPYDYIEVFKRHGLVDRYIITEFRDKFKKQHEPILKAIILMENMDYSPRTLDEIKGRLDLYCEQNNSPKLEKEETIRFLSFLSSDMLNIVNCRDGKYSLRYMPNTAKERIKSVIGSLCGIISLT